MKRAIFTALILGLFLNVALASAATPGKYRDGSLVVDHGTVFIIYQGKKYGFTSKEVFLGLNYQFADVVAGDLSTIPEGLPISSA